MPPLRIRYQTIEFGELDVHLRTLRDRQEFDDPDGAAEKLGVHPASWPLFGVVWESGEALAHLMQDFEIGGKRILEVGCGIGLASLLLSQRGADITATDHNPDAGVFLLENVKLNGGQPIPFVRTGWSEAVSDLGRFDLIIGSDLLYDPQCVPMLSAFVHQHARDRCEIILIDPGRGFSGRFCRRMETLGYAASSHQAVGRDEATPFKGRELRFTR